MTTIGALALGFAAGSVPFGYLLVRLAGRGDVRDKGSGNIGATNVARVLGAAGWVATLLADGGKGVVGVVAGAWLAGEAGAAAGGLGAILGHCFTPFLGGKGGKGVATMLGAFGVLAPLATGVAMVAFAVVVIVTRIVSLASLVGVVALALTVKLAGDHFGVVMAAWTAVVVVTLRHRENLRRLRAGTESRAGVPR